jgi:hydroxysqualene dehydroxylase
LVVPSTDTSVSREPVIVVGGGCAGLAAGTWLAERGVAVHVLEARPTLGGRANTFREPTTGERVDNGQHVLAGCYVETLQFLRRIGSERLLHRPSTLCVPQIDRAGHRSELVLPPVPAPLDLVAATLAWPALTMRDRWSILRIRHAIRGREPVDANMTVRQWLEQYGQSSRVCELLWEPLALAALNQSIDEAAASAFVAVTSRMFSAEPGASVLLIPAVPLDELFSAPASHYLRRRGAAVSTHAKARIVVEDGRVAGVQVRDEFLYASAVICAVPWFELPGVFNGVPAGMATTLRDAAATESSPIVTVNLWFEGYQPDELFVGLPGRTFQWVFARARVVGGSARHLSLVSSGARDVCLSANAEIVRRAVDELREAMPALRRVPLQHAHVIRERRATFSLRPGGPPRPSVATPVRGLFLAGDWIDTGLPATIESAVISGHRAAAAAISCLQSSPITRRSR